MTRFLLFSFFSAILLNLPVPGGASAQDHTPDRLFHVYVDDDYLNVRGKGTDDAYTGGTRFAFFYTKDHPSRFFFDKALPKAGDSSVNVFGWSLMQIMFTPDNICDPSFQPNDYPWSGALFATHSLYSYNRAKKYDFQTGLLVGMMGPAALAGPAQTAVHEFIRYLKPLGWNNQYGNSPLVNIDFTVEKQEAGSGRFLEVIGGSQLAAGTALDQLTLYQLIRIGKMTPYFNGYLSQFSASRETGGRQRKTIQAYLFVKPELELVAYDAILQGGIFSSKPHIVSEGVEGKNRTAGYHDINHALAEVDYGAVLVIGHFSIAYTQKPTTAYMKGLYSHDVGNVSVYFSWDK
ncbi:MAG: lipid A deacylase LpxR family protein [Puia sp.]|nr:lipid A deacylase LpxR family protein [Puia sp.]